MNIIEIIGWVGTILIVGAYFLNINGKVKSTSIPYILSNLVGGILFSIYTFVHHTYPNMVVNVVWVIIAIVALMKKDK
jgi:purine-cytosine permease-like protein